MCAKISLIISKKFAINDFAQHFLIKKRKKLFLNWSEKFIVRIKVMRLLDLVYIYIYNTLSLMLKHSNHTPRTLNMWIRRNKKIKCRSPVLWKFRGRNKHVANRVSITRPRDKFVMRKSIHCEREKLIKRPFVSFYSTCILVC